MKISKKFLSVVLATAMLFMAVPFAFTASAETEGYYTYTVSNGEATITECDTSISGDVVIPSTLGGFSVTKIDEYAFNSCRSLKSITIPKNVEKIYDDVFNNCDALERINVDKANTYYSSDENGVLFDKNKTALIRFPSGSKLTSYKIPIGVIQLNVDSFFDCNNLREIVIPDSVKKYVMVPL